MEWSWTCMYVLSNWQDMVGDWVRNWHDHRLKMRLGMSMGDQKMWLESREWHSLRMQMLLSMSVSKITCLAVGHNHSLINSTRVDLINSNHTGPYHKSTRWVRHRHWSWCERLVGSSSDWETQACRDGTTQNGGDGCRDCAWDGLHEDERAKTERYKREYQH